MQVTKGTWHMCEQCVPGCLSSSPAQEPGNEASVAYDSGIQFKPYCRVMVSVRYIRRVLKSKMLSLWQQWLVSSRSGRSMNFKKKDYIIHVSPCLPGMDKWANNFCKWRAECLHHFLDIVWTELVSSPDPQCHASSDIWRGKKGRRVW